MRELVIAGAGGFGREVRWTLERLESAGKSGWKFIGFADDAPALSSQPGVLGKVEAALKAHPDAAVFPAFGDNAARASFAERFADREMPYIIDPAATVAGDAVFGPGCYVGPFALVSTGAKLGRCVLANARCGIGHDCEIGDFAQICPGASISGAVRIGAGTLVGSNAAILPELETGAWSTVAAGTTVFRNIPPGFTASPFGTGRTR